MVFIRLKKNFTRADFTSYSEYRAYSALVWKTQVQKSGEKWSVSSGLLNCRTKKTVFKVEKLVLIQGNYQKKTLINYSCEMENTRCNSKGSLSKILEHGKFYVITRQSDFGSEKYLLITTKEGFTADAMIYSREVGRFIYAGNY
jgi:hypothetical protein